MKKKALIAIMLVCVLALSACGETAKQLNTGDLVYQVLAEDEIVGNIENVRPNSIYLGYEASDGYLEAEITDPEQISLLCDAFVNISVAGKTADEDITYYPSRTIDFDFGDDNHSYFSFADDNCYTYDSKKDILTYYELADYEEFFAMADILIITNNEDYFSNEYVVYEDDEAKASIVDYKYQESGNTFNVVFKLSNSGDSPRVFAINNLVINDMPVACSTKFVIDGNMDFQYAAPISLGDMVFESFDEIDFTLRVSDDLENPTFETETETVTLLPSAN